MLTTDQILLQAQVQNRQDVVRLFCQVVQCDQDLQRRTGRELLRHVPLVQNPPPDRLPPGPRVHLDELAALCRQLLDLYRAETEDEEPDA